MEIGIDACKHQSEHYGPGGFWSQREAHQAHKKTNEPSRCFEVKHIEKAEHDGTIPVCQPKKGYCQSSGARARGLGKSVVRTQKRVPLRRGWENTPSPARKQAGRRKQPAG